MVVIEGLIGYCLCRYAVRFADISQCTENGAAVQPYYPGDSVAPEELKPASEHSNISERPLLTCWRRTKDLAD